MKVKILVSIMRHQNTRTRAFIALGVSDCPFCPGVYQKICHLFFGCPHLHPLWMRVLPARTATVSPANEVSQAFSFDRLTGTHILIAELPEAVYRYQELVFIQKLKFQRFAIVPVK